MSHNPGWLKQSNKKHKTKKASARAINLKQGGKVLVPSQQSEKKSKTTPKDEKKQRVLRDEKSKRNQRSTESRKNKREALVLQRRIAGSASAIADPPLNVCIIGLAEDANPEIVAKNLLLSSSSDKIQEVLLRPGKASIALFPKEKVRISVTYVERDVISVLDGTKAADVILFLLPLHDGTLSMDMDDQNDGGYDDGNRTVATGKTGMTKMTNLTQKKINRNVKGGSVLAKFFENAVDPLGRTFITVTKSQGLPPVVGVIQGLDQVPLKRRAGAKKNAVEFFREEFGQDTKVVDLNEAIASTEKEQLQRPLLRALMETSPRLIHWRSERSYLQALEVGQDSTSNEGEHNLAISGYLRGQPLNVHSLVHVPGFGTFSIKRIEKFVTDPNSLRNHPRNKPSSSSMQEDVGEENTVIFPDPAKVPSLEEEASPDLLAGEQTWPTPEELAQAEASIRRSGADDDDDDDVQMKATTISDSRTSKKKKVGASSEYQRAWLDDEELAEDEAQGDLLKEKKPRKKHHDNNQNGENNEEYDHEDDDDEDEENDDDDDDDDDATITRDGAYEAYKKKLKAEAEDVDFPDEVDTPRDIAARIRFQKYRGLKSYKNSPWHPKESLPREYSRIHELSNYPAVQRLVLQQGSKLTKAWLNQASSTLSSSEASKKTRSSSMETDIMTNEDQAEIIQTLNSFCALPGEYVKIVLANVSVEVKERILSDSYHVPIVLGSLLEHEQKLSVVHALVQRSQTLSTPVRSREVLWMHCGLWRREVRPTFSENNINCDKNRFERFLQPGRWVMASSYAPITFGSNVPVLYFRPADNALVATGSLHSVNPDRIVLKKIVLTAHPLRVKKRYAVVRYMFFNSDDVNWFKPIELWTKHGSNGRILAPVGLHGRMKCQFDIPITQMDTICMSLYKRVFPKPVHEFKELQEDDNNNNLGDDDDDDDDDEGLEPIQEDEE